MDIIQLLNNVNAIIDTPWFKITLCCIILVFSIFIIWKWNIFIFFKDRIWRLLVGKQYANFSDPDLCVFHNNNIEIAHFNALYGVSANTIEQIHKYQIWLYKNDVSFNQISKIKPYFDIKSLSLTKISIKRVIAFIFLYLIVFFFTLPCLYFIETSSALIELKNDGTSLWLSNHSAESATFLLPPTIIKPRWTLNASECNSLTKWAKSAHMSKESAEIICKLFSDERSHREASKIVKEQKIIFGILSIWFLLIQFSIINSFVQFYLVSELKAQIKKHRTHS